MNFSRFMILYKREEDKIFWILKMYKKLNGNNLKKILEGCECKKAKIYLNRFGAYFHKVHIV